MAELVATTWLDRASGLKVEATSFKSDDSMRFAVRSADGSCLNKQGGWEWEPLPSSRDDAFLARCRWDSLDAASKALDVAVNNAQ